MGRNDKCVCGSGKKFKLCCGAGPTAAAKERQVAEEWISREEHQRILTEIVNEVEEKYAHKIAGPIDKIMKKLVYEPELKIGPDETGRIIWKLLIPIDERSAVRAFVEAEQPVIEAVCYYIGVQLAVFCKKLAQEPESLKEKTSRIIKPGDD